MFDWFWMWVQRCVRNAEREVKAVNIGTYSQPESPTGNSCTVEVADGGFVITRWNPKLDRRELFVATNEEELVEKINVALIISRLV